jgi:putative transcriptional regulator
MRKTGKHRSVATGARTGWHGTDVMTASEHHAAATADPDAQPITAEDLATGRVRRVPRVRTLRRALRLSQDEFATRYRIPVGTLRDWEQGRKEPDAAAKAYLHVIASEPEVVRRALARRLGGRRAD